MSRRYTPPRYLPGSAVTRDERDAFTEQLWPRLNSIPDARDVEAERRAEQHRKKRVKRMYQVSAYEMKRGPFAPVYFKAAPSVMCEKCLKALRDNRHVWGLTHTELPREQWPTACPCCRVRTGGVPNGR